MKSYRLVIALIAAIILLGCTQIQQYIQMGNQTNQTCAQQNQSCGYGTASPTSLSLNQTFYGKCCEGYACVEGYCRKATENCTGKGQLCAYGPTNLAHPDNLTYYGECCEGQCVNGYCKSQCKTSGSCTSASDCCSGFECRQGQCRQPCKSSGSCSSNSDCCSGYYCNQSMQCAKPCQTSGNCTLNSDCCSGYFCGQNLTCTPEPKCVGYRMPCNSSWQCCSSFTCINGICSNSSCNWGAACNDTSECCLGLYCGQSGICNAQRCMEIGGLCNTTNDCCLGRKCANATCVNRTCASLNESCSSLSCCSGLTCLNYNCVSPCKITGTCFTDSDCCSGYFCHPAGYCAKPTCTYEYANCTNSSQCCSGLDCNNGQCTKHCKHSGPCASNAECCVGYYCDSNNTCVLQPSSLTCANSYPTCTGSCTSGSCYNIGTGSCVCGAYTDSSCTSLCSISYSAGRKVHSASECIQGETYLQGCCCSGGAQPQLNWFCCHNDVIGYTCSQSACPPTSLLISGPYTSQGSCSSNCSAPQGQCSVSTPLCGSECSMYHQSQLSVCGSGSCPSGYTQLTGNASCANNPPCDRCCCQTNGVLYTQQTCQALSQNGSFTHSQLAPGDAYWQYMDCYNFAQTHCHDYHNGGTAPSGGLKKNCCYWYCSDERQ